MNTEAAFTTGRHWARELITFLTWAARTRSKGSGRVRAGDVELYYKRYGTGEPVLLLHGGFTVLEAWAGQIPSLARDYMVVAMDSRGHGRSTLGFKPMTYEQLGADAAALIEALGIGPVNLIGDSDGGIASLALAMRRPDLVHSMVLLGTSFNTDNYAPGAWRAIDEFLRPWSPAMLSVRALRRVMNPERRTWGRFLRGMSEMWRTEPDYTADDLAKIHAPTLVIACDRDEYLSAGEDPLAVFKEITRAIPNARMVLIPGGTHTINIEHAETVNNMIEEFYRDIPTRLETDFSRMTSEARARR